MEVMLTKEVLAKQEELKVRVKEESLIYAHVGCGPQIYDGFINIDKYHNEDKRVLPCCMSELPFSDSYLDGIVSNHSLEHLNYRDAQKALYEWNRVLKNGGKLYLTIPDLEEICRLIISPDVSFVDKHYWYIYTMFGYQAKGGTEPNDLEQPDDPGQHHRCGFTAQSINYFLQCAGFKVDEIKTYDGFKTPSLWIVATK